MAWLIQLRNGTQAEWAAANPILAQGELTVELDTGRWKLGDGVSTWSALKYGADPTIPTILVTANKTIGLSDKFTMQKCLSSSDITITIPLDATTAFPVDTEIVVIRYGAGGVIIAGETAGVTIHSAQSLSTITQQYEGVTLKKMSANEWLVLGALIAA